LSLHLLPDAQDDIARAVAWHEMQRAGRGQACADAIDAALRSIESLPRIGTEVTPAVPGREVRRVVVQGYPYTVFYEVVGTDAVVLAVSHQKQRPGGWVTRLP
jgi:plasmid stabilization system protein ParE